MLKVYEVSGNVFMRNEFEKGSREYERTWEIRGAGQWIAESAEKLEEIIRTKNSLHNGKFTFMEIRDLSIEFVCEFEWNSQGTAPLCGDNPDGSHWSWFGNHEPECQLA
jgi:hypothetical protein